MPKKITIDIIKEYSLLDGTICLSSSSEYKNNLSKLTFKCIKEHIYTMSWSNFKSGQRCRYCAFNIPSIEFIKEYSLKNGSICISDEYIKNDKKLKFICLKRNHIYNTTWSCFYNKNSRCQMCHIIELSYKQQNENHHNWNSDRTRKIRLKYFSFDLKKYRYLSDDENYNDYILNKSKYNIDHIYPRAAFIDNNLDILYDKRLIKEICNSRDNLRIIPKEININKKDKYNQEEFMSWFQTKIKEK